MGIDIFCAEGEDAWYVPFIKASLVKAEKRNAPLTAMGWEIYPESIYAILKKLGAYSNIPKLIVTENGAAFNDELLDGVVADDYRIHFLKNHIAQVARARKEGVKVEGYFVWSFLDNFEWAEGYDPRFGLVYVYFETQERVVKNSGKWYGEFAGRLKNIIFPLTKQNNFSFYGKRKTTTLWPLL